MKYLFFIFLPLFSFSSQCRAAQYQHCCACINEESEEPEAQINSECRRWLREADKIQTCELSLTLDRIATTDLKSQDNSCKTLSIWGAFHGNSSYADYPFNVSQSLAHAYSASKVDYDGSSCLLFDNLQDVEKEAAKLAAQDKSIDYRISGNQNIGVTFGIALLVGRHEEKSKSSKATVLISQGKVSMQYAPCSKPGERCVIADFKTGSKNDPNQKWCMDGISPDPVTQSCCTKKHHSAETLPGKWQKIGMDCEIIPN